MVLAQKGVKRKKPARYLLAKVRPVYPKSYEREYYRILKSVVKDLKEVTMEEIEEAKSAIRGDGEAVRLDANLRNGMMDRIKQKLADRKTKSKAKERVRKVQQGVKAQEEANLQKSYTKALGVSAVVFNTPSADEYSEEWLEMQDGLIDNFVQTYEDKLFTRVASAVARGLFIYQMMGEVTKLLSETTNRAKFISTNEVGNLSSGVVKAQQEDCGVEAYQWLTVGDEKVRLEHQKRDGEFFWWSRSKTAEGMINGQVIHLAPEYHPSEDYNCRCRAVPVIDIENINIARAVPVGMIDPDEDLEVGIAI